jgi:hypothetical protein
MSDFPKYARRSSVSGPLDLGMFDGLLQDFEDEVDVLLGGVDAHQADAPDLAGSGSKAAGDLKHVPEKSDKRDFV